MAAAKHDEEEEDSKEPGGRLRTRGRRCLVVLERVSANHSASGNTKTLSANPEVLEVPAVMHNGTGDGVEDPGDSGLTLVPCSASAGCCLPGSPVEPGQDGGEGGPAGEGPHLCLPERIRPRLREISCRTLSAGGQVTASVAGWALLSGRKESSWYPLSSQVLLCLSATEPWGELERSGRGGLSGSRYSAGW